MALMEIIIGAIGGIALSTTSMAVVYAVMLEYGFNKTEYGKGILGSCFVNDLGTVIGLGLIFAPFTFKTLIFIHHPEKVFFYRLICGYHRMDNIKISIINAS